MEKQVLNPDFYSDTWKFVKDAMEKAIQIDRMNLERDLTEVQTAKLRGRIQGLKSILDAMEKLSAIK